MSGHLDDLAPDVDGEVDIQIDFSPEAYARVSAEWGQRKAQALEQLQGDTRFLMLFSEDKSEPDMFGVRVVYGRSTPSTHEGNLYLLHACRHMLDQLINQHEGTEED